MEQISTQKNIVQFPGTAEQFHAVAERLACRFPTYCDWCIAEGMRTQTGWSTVQGTSKICERHNEQLQSEIAQLR